MSTVYISPTGAGDRSGSSWANAATITALDSMVKKAGAGGEVLLLADAGTYKVTSQIAITGSGTASAPVTIKGVSASGADMNVHIEGSRPATYAAGNASGNELFKLMAGASNLTFANFSIANTGTAFRVGGDVSNLKIQNVEATNVGRFLEDYASGSAKTATINGLTLQDIDVQGFSKGVVRLQYDTHNVLIQNVTGDSQRQDGDDFAIGVHLDGTVHDVVIRNVTMANATDTVGGSYWNGDGFATERGVYNVLLQDTVSRGNTDAGYDIKSTATTLLRTVADDNARNYRIWGEATLTDAQALNPHLRGGSSSQEQIWVAKGSIVKIIGGTIADSGSKTTVFDNSGSITLSGTDITYAKTAQFSINGKPVGYLPTEIVKVPATGTSSTGLDWLSTPAITAAALSDTAAQAAPVITTPTPAPAVVLKLAADGAVTHLSTSANETFTGTAARDVFDYSGAGKQGADIIKNFGSSDTLVLRTAAVDGNKDGIITFGQNGLLELSSSAGTLKLGDLKNGLRALGHTDEGYIYGAAQVRPKGALEGKLGIADTLTGDAGDKAATRFFADTALHRDLGDDVLRNFGAKDVLMTTSQIGDGAIGTHVDASNGHFALWDHGTDVGSVSLFSTSGAAINSIEYDGSQIVNGVTYFIYSTVGSAAGLS